VVHEKECHVHSGLLKSHSWKVRTHTVYTKANP
jgi:hypothetical protein